MSIHAQSEVMILRGNDWKNVIMSVTENWMETVHRTNSAMNLIKGTVPNKNVSLP